MLPLRYFLLEPLHPECMRWALCAKEVCFKNEFLR